jgi:hypothetical protein
VLILKDLYMVASAMKRLEGSAAEEAQMVELEKALVNVKEYLNSTKTFEYTGKLEMRGGNVIKLTDIQTDLDDVVMALNGGSRQVDFDVFLCLVVHDKPEMPEAQVIAC